MLSKTKPYRNAKHLVWVRSKPCVHCRSDVGVIAHHIIGVSLGMRGTGTKPSDGLTIPLCPRCHADVHSSGGTDRIDQLFYFARMMGNAFDNEEVGIKCQKP